MIGPEERFEGIQHAFFVDHVDVTPSTVPGSAEDKRSRERDHLDHLLAYFSMVELACLSGHLSGFVLPEEHVALARRVLGHEGLRRYYEERSRLLPRLHLMRIEHAGMPWSTVNESEHGDALFDEFFTLTQLRTDRAMETFVDLLHGGQRGGVVYDDVLGVLGDPESLLVHLAIRSDQGGGEVPPLSAAVQGFFVCSELAPRLLGVMEDARPLPLFQSAMWHYHAHWLGQMSRTAGQRMRAAFRVLDNREADGAEEPAEWERVMNAEARQARAQQELALGFLSSGRYEFPLVELLLSSAAGREGNLSFAPGSGWVSPMHREDDDQEGTTRAQALEPG